MQSKRIGMILGAVGALVVAQSAQAVLISFDGTGYNATGTVNSVVKNSSQNYIAGRDLTGQGNTTNKWALNTGTNAFVVVAAMGRDGTSAVVTTSGGLANQNNSITLTPSELGTTAFTSTSKLNFSLEVGLAYVDPTKIAGNVFLSRIFIGNQGGAKHAVGLKIHSNGNLTDGANNVLATGLFSTAGVYHTLHGTIDYGTGKYSLYKDTDTTPLVAAHVFDGSTTPDGFGSFGLNNLSAGSVGGIMVDNISLSVPEPTTVSLVGVGAVGFLSCRRRPRLR